MSKNGFFGSLRTGLRVSSAILSTAGPVALAAALVVIASGQPVPAYNPSDPIVPERVPIAYQPTDHYDSYRHILRASGATSTALGGDWVEMGREAVRRAVPIALPFRETGWLDEARADAIGYRFDAPRGRRVVITVDTEQDAPQRLFVDLYRMPDGAARRDDGNRRVRQPVHIATGAGVDRRVEFRVIDNGTYTLRIQPELLRGGRYTVTIRTDAALLFPVAGYDSRAVQSHFGVARDGGRRTHRGVDIFAPIGTPVVAGTDAGVVWVGELPLGGKVVWLELEGGHNLYYAHLDDYKVVAGQRVAAGEVLGWVGKTGNARTTPPHLHFGVYLDVRDAVDPYPFLTEFDHAPPAVVAEISTLGGWARPAAEGIELEFDQHRRSLNTSLGDDASFRVEGASGDRYRVRLSDNTVGYVSASAVEPIPTR